MTNTSNTKNSRLKVPLPPRSGRKLPELLAPAGNMEKLVTAVHYGADAVYLGGRNYSLRAGSGNFENPKISEAVGYAHEHGVKVYITVNIFAHNRDIKGLEEYLRVLRDAGADGLIVADPGVLLLCRKTVPDIPVHLSTQANVTNSTAVRFWADQGVTRVNLARELGLRELLEIRQSSEIELEVFVHGALCISYSGRCMLSNYFTGRNANKGNCAHPCRYSYALVEEKRPGQYFPVEEDERGTYIFNSRDLCLLGRLPELIAAGADAVKIEGRMKSTGYVAATVRVYRAALDYIKKNIDLRIPLEEIKLPDSFLHEIEKIGTRGRTENFFDESPSVEAMLYDTIRMNQAYSPVGIVRNSRPLVIEARNVLETGDQIEYLGRKFEPVVCTVVSMETLEGIPQKRANPGNRIVITTLPVLDQAEIHTILRKKIVQNKM